MGVGTLTRALAHPFPSDILASIRFSVGGLPASAARQTPQYDARSTTKTREPLADGEEVTWLRTAISHMTCCCRTAVCRGGVA
jgi:hypothetical protein